MGGEDPAQLIERPPHLSLIPKRLPWGGVVVARLGAVGIEEKDEGSHLDHPSPIGDESIEPCGTWLEAPELLEIVGHHVLRCPRAGTANYRPVSRPPAVRSQAIRTQSNLFRATGLVPVNRTRRIQNEGRFVQPDEVDAVVALQSGDMAGLQVLVQRYQLPALRLAFNLCRNRQEAEDAVAEAFIAVARHIGGYDRSRPFAPWFYRIVINAARAAARRGRSVPTVSD